MLRNKRVTASLAEQLFVSHAGLGLILVAHQSLFHSRTQSKARLLLDITSRYGVKKYAETRVQGGHNDKECDSLKGSNKSTAFLWAITQRVVVIPYRRLGTTCRPHLLQGSRIILKDGTDRLSRNVGKELSLLAE